MEQAKINLLWAAALMDGLVKAGVQYLVASPGSRNTPLLLAAEQHPILDIKIIVDERSAAFFALGLARSSARPVAVAATSGSAPANWFPAVVEASAAGVPLLLLSADRPWELQHCVANQTLDQSHMFGRYSRDFFALPAAEDTETSRTRLEHLVQQAVRKSLSINSGPVQINMPFRDPLVTTETAVFSQTELGDVYPAPKIQPDSKIMQQVVQTLTTGEGVILAGNGCGDADAILRLAKVLNVPVFADPLSNLRCRSSAEMQVFCHYDLFLASPEVASTLQPSWILRFGALPVSQHLYNWLLQQTTATQLVVDSRARWSDPQAAADEIIFSDTTLFCDSLIAYDVQSTNSDLLASCTVLEQAQKTYIENNLVALPPEAQAIRLLMQQLPEDSLLFSGNSLAIRYLDSYSSAQNKNLQIVGNRGVSGIDGNLSTLLGLATGTEIKGKVAAVLGDLTFFHDMTALNMARDLAVLLIVFNNNGGGIFEHLPQAELTSFDRLWKTPVDLDIQKTADLFGIQAQKVTEISDFSAACSRAMQQTGFSIIEVVVDSKLSCQAHQNSSQRS